jgi:hypothetical protein
MSIENSRLYIMTLYRWNYDRKGPKLLVNSIGESRTSVGFLFESIFVNRSKREKNQ